ncbi:OmpA family protein [Polynucleobacter sp. AM-7D1]|uniref:OmpA family protein n=1 Tax=Polynucleobacter sp. AM-7D1 TaxID=2689102 RepID=UPI001BFD198A|nr:OmpA family protein [Polynucleobacter sp. AM-7D1]QWE27915.1 OmpA family protein [Polynucleobacter sp. AM-7D1]
MSKNSSFIAMSDFMTSLFMIFLLLTVVLLTEVSRLSINEDSAKKTRIELLGELQTEFAQDLPKWDAQILDDLTLRFKNPDLMFAIGKADVRPEFKAVMDSFLPRYFAIITKPRFKPYIKELRIEGHTSALWALGTDSKTAYLLNMELSQKRALSTLAYTLQNAGDNYDWLVANLYSIGLSSSKPIDVSVNDIRNQRVEFKINLIGNNAK